MKKILAVILTVMLILSVCPLGAFNLTASAATSGTTGDCTWSLDGTVLTISGNGAMANYSYNSTLPWGKNITEVIIETGVTSIGNYAFNGCSSLASITIPDSVTSIGEGAFYDCSALSSITIGDGVTSIGDWAFAGCTSLTSVTIPDSVTSIGSSPFSGCSSLKSVYITDIAAWCNIKFSSSYANPMCYAENLYLNGKLVTKIEIPDGVTSIDDYAFQGCSSLSSITIPDSVTSIGEGTFYDCSALSSITIPDGVTSIGDWAFYNCRALSSITIPDSVTSIGDWAFDWCTSLTSITIPDSVTSIGEIAFSDCSSLTSITIPDSVTSIGDLVFSNCYSLTSITIPDSVTSIGDFAFYNCSALSSITIPDSVTSIGDSAFAYCNSLSSITIPDSVTSIGDYAFERCRSLASITIPKSVTSISDNAFAYCSALSSITIPDSVTSIGDDAFFCCGALTNVYITDIAAWCNIKLSSSYANPLYYGAELYLNNQLLTEITVPDIQIIGEYQYYNIKSLKNVFLPKELVLIKQNAFYGCSAIENVYFEGTADEWAAVTVLSGNDYIKNANVYFNCTGIPGGLIGIELTKLPDKLQYIEKKETLDLTGGILTLKYDGATKDIDLATLNVEGFNNTRLGKQTITVKYGAYSTQFEIEIIERPKTFVSIIQLPDKNQYKFGETLDLTGGKIAVGYSDGTYEILDITADMVSGYDANDIGYQILTVTYGSFTANFIVSVTNDGDLNGDGKVDLLDLVKFKKIIAGVDQPSYLPLDFDGDGDETAKDMIILMNIILAPNKNNK